MFILPNTKQIQTNTAIRFKNFVHCQIQNVNTARWMSSTTHPGFHQRDLLLNKLFMQNFCQMPIKTWTISIYFCHCLITFKKRKAYRNRTESNNFSSYNRPMHLNRILRALIIDDSLLFKYSRRTVHDHGSGRHGGAGPVCTGALHDGLPAAAAAAEPRAEDDSAF